MKSLAACFIVLLGAIGFGMYHVHGEQRFRTRAAQGGAVVRGRALAQSFNMVPVQGPVTPGARTVYAYIIQDGNNVTIVPQASRVLRTPNGLVVSLPDGRTDTFSRNATVMPSAIVQTNSNPQLYPRTYHRR